MVRLYLKVRVDGASVSSRLHQELEHVSEFLKNQYKLTHKISNKTGFPLTLLFISLLTRPDCLSQSDIIHTQYFHISSLGLVTNVFRPRGRKLLVFMKRTLKDFTLLLFTLHPQNRK